MEIWWDTPVDSKNFKSQSEQNVFSKNKPVCHDTAASSSFANSHPSFKKFGNPEAEVAYMTAPILERPRGYAFWNIAMEDGEVTDGKYMELVTSALKGCELLISAYLSPKKYKYTGD